MNSLVELAISILKRGKMKFKNNRVILFLLILGFLIINIPYSEAWHCNFGGDEADHCCDKAGDDCCKGSRCSNINLECVSGKCRYKSGGGGGGTPCQTEPAGCYKKDNGKVDSGTLKPAEFNFYRVQDKCSKSGSCNCPSGSTENPDQVTDPDSRQEACGCIKSSEYNSVGNCCGNDAADCGRNVGKYLCRMGTSISQQASWVDGNSNYGDSSDTPCDGASYLSAGDLWIKCDDTFRVNTEYSQLLTPLLTHGYAKIAKIKDHEYLCRGYGPKAIVECCGSGTCQSKDSSILSLTTGQTINPTPSINGPRPSFTIDSYSATTSTPSNCGNNQIDSNEDCDGTNLNSKTCTNIPGGFTGGTLACYPNTAGNNVCKFDTRGCTGGTQPTNSCASSTLCGNCRIDPGEGCDSGIDNGQGGCNIGTDCIRCQCVSPTTGDVVRDITGEVTIITGFVTESSERLTVSQNPITIEMGKTIGTTSNGPIISVGGGSTLGSGWLYSIETPSDISIAEVSLYNGPLGASSPSNGFLIITGKSIGQTTVRIKDSGAASVSVHKFIDIQINVIAQYSYQGTPKGFLDVVDCNTIAGWACDDKIPAMSIKVSFTNYRIDGTHPYSDIPSILAVNSRPDIAGVCGGNPNHVFSFPTPNILKDGQSYYIRADAIGGTNILLGTKVLGPCSAPTPSPTPQPTPTTPPTTPTTPTPTPTPTQPTTPQAKNPCTLPIGSCDAPPGNINYENDVKSAISSYISGHSQIASARNDDFNAVKDYLNGVAEVLRSSGRGFEAGRVKNCNQNEAADAIIVRKSGDQYGEYYGIIINVGSGRTLRDTANIGYIEKASWSRKLEPSNTFGDNMIYYCRSDGTFSINLDTPGLNSQGNPAPADRNKETCEKANFQWTGTKCCGESGVCEFHNEPGQPYSGSNSCWNNSLKPSISLFENNAVILYGGNFHGCAIDKTNYIPQNNLLLKLFDKGTNNALITNHDYCFNDPQKDYFCSYNETWQPTYRKDRTKLSRAPQQNPKQAAECCAATECWNETACIANQRSNPLAQPLDGFRCIDGEWKKSNLKCAPDGEPCGYCGEESQCMLNPLSQNIQAQCANSGDYSGDNYCDNGVWSTRTRLLALKLLAMKSPSDDFTMFCDDKNGALNNLLYVLDSGDLASGIITNLDANNFCILKAGNKIIVGTSINNDIGQVRNGFNIFGVTSCPNARDDNSYYACDGTNRIWYNKQMKSLIYSANSISVTSAQEQPSSLSGAIKNIINKIKAIITQPPFDESYVNSIKKFDKIYLAKQGSKYVRGALEGKEFKNAVVEYAGFDNTNICAYIAGFNRASSYSLSGISCGNEGSNYYVLVQGSQLASLDPQQIWPDLTAKLRLK